MSFGLCNSPATFQSLMENVLAGLSPDTCMVYINDVIVTGKIFEEHLQRGVETTACCGAEVEADQLSVSLRVAEWCTWAL